jgi:hypothetical protein
MKPANRCSLSAEVIGEGFVMEGSIFIVREDNSLARVERTPYNTEKSLQDLLTEYHDLLAGDQMDAENPRRWVLISPEMQREAESDGTDGWRIDHLFLDHEAIPTIVEVKLRKDTRIRREVIGQMLDYAASLEDFWSAELMRRTFEERCKAAGCDAVHEITALLREESEPDAETKVDEFWALVNENLATGNIRLLFVADEFPRNFQRVIKFLNRYMKPVTVLAVEVNQFEGFGLKALVPRVLGLTIENQHKKGGVARTTGQWNKESFMSDARQRLGDDITVVTEIENWMRLNGLKDWFGKGALGSYGPILIHGREHYLFYIITDGCIRINFKDMTARNPFCDENKRLDLLQRLNAITGIEIPATAINGYPALPISALNDSDALIHFLEAFDWYIGEIKSAPTN